jgi:hypothetical protein
MPEKTMNDAATETPVEVQPLPTSQEVADTLSRALDATCDVLVLLDQDTIRLVPSSLEDIALVTIMGELVAPGEAFARRMSRYLDHLPQPTEARHHTRVPSRIVDDDIPF